MVFYLHVHSFKITVMKHIFLLIIIAVFTGMPVKGLFGQASGVAINTTGSAPDSCAILDVQSPTKGVLLPRITTAVRTGPGNGLLDLTGNLPHPCLGLTVFDINLGCYYINTSPTIIPNWMPLCGGGIIRTHSTVGASNISSANLAWTDMTDMSINFTPITNKVYIRFWAEGILGGVFVSASDDDYGTMNFRLLLNGVPVFTSSATFGGSFSTSGGISYVLNVPPMVPSNIRIQWYDDLHDVPPAADIDNSFRSLIIEEVVE